MRFVTAAIIAGAVALVLAIAIFVRIDQPPDAVSVRIRGEGATPARRSDRVEKRLSKIRDDGRHGANTGNAPSAPRAAGPRPPSEAASQIMKDRAKDMPRHAVAVPPTAAAELQPEGMDQDELQEFEELKTTLLTDPDPEERVGAVLMLTGAEGEAAWRLLADALQDPDAEVRLAVVEALGDYSDDIPPALLTPALNDADPEVRFEAYGILGDMENTEALNYVRNCLSDPDEDVRSLCEGILEFAEDE